MSEDRFTPRLLWALWCYIYWILKGTGPNMAVPASTPIPAGLLHRLGMSARGCKGLHVEEEVEVICSANTGGRQDHGNSPPCSATPST